MIEDTLIVCLEKMQPHSSQIELVIYAHIFEVEKDK